MKKTILVADDDKNIVELIKENMSYRGYRVITAYDGKTAYRLIKKEKPDLAILDIMIPDIDGFTLDLEIEDEEELKYMPIIIITGKQELKELFDNTKEAKVSAWFEKPFDIDKLINKVEELLNKKNSNKS